MNDMPGFTTHYLFGLNTYKHLDDIEIKKHIHENHAAYSLGLQGPDVFFYFLPWYWDWSYACDLWGHCRRWPCICVAENMAEDCRNLRSAGSNDHLSRNL